VTGTHGRELVGTGSRSVSTYSNAFHDRRGKSFKKAWNPSSPSKRLDTTTQRPPTPFGIPIPTQRRAFVIDKPDKAPILAAWPNGKALDYDFAVGIKRLQVRSLPWSHHNIFLLLFSIYFFSLPVLRSKFPLHGLPFVTCESVAGCEFSMYVPR
jgi:hypothetical protein